MDVEFGSDVPLTPDTADVYAAVRHALKQAGTPIPMNDVWICAHALEIGLTFSAVAAAAG